MPSAIVLPSFRISHRIVYDVARPATGGIGPLLPNGPEEWRDAEESVTAVATFTILVIEALTRSGTFACPTRVPETETVRVRIGTAPIAPAGSVENVNEPIPKAPGASAARDGAVSLLKTTVRSGER